MAEVLAEKLAQRAFQLNLLDERQLESVRSEFPSGEAPAAVFRSIVLRKELMTNFQLERLVKGEITGYFYGDYKVLYLTGSGTFARVYRSVHSQNGKVFAVKVLRKRFRNDPAQMELFLREGEVGLLLRHPNVVPVYEVNSDASLPFFVMDFVEGQNLREFVKVRKKLDVKDSIKLITDVVSGLAYAAEQGIFHRDLKLSNVLITSRGQARLVDFGLYGTRGAKDSDGDTPNARTVDYVGLERATNCKKNDPRSDIFFAGCMFYHLLSGQPPLVETRERLVRLSVQRYREVKPITEHDSTLPRAVVAVVQRAMELDPERRYQNPNEMLFDLQVAAKRIGVAEATAATVNSASEPLPQIADDGELRAGVEQEGANHTVMLVETNVEIQNVLRERLKKHGYRVLVIGDPQRALDRFQEEQTTNQRAADCVVFSATELGETAVAAFNQFGTDEKTKQIPAVLFLDEEQTGLVEQATLARHRALLRMPLKVRELRQTLYRLLHLKPVTA